MSEKLPDLPRRTSAEDNFLLYGVDPNDTTDSVDGTSVGISKADILKEFINVAPNVTQTVKVKLAEITLTSGAPGEFDFDSIDQTYDRLIIEGRVRSDANATTDGAYLLFNADTTTANYYRQAADAEGGTATTSANATPNFLPVPAATSDTEGYANFCTVIEDYTRTDTHKIGVTTHGAYRNAAMITGTRSVMNTNETSAITRLRVRTDNDPTDQLFGVVTLYGEKDTDAVPIAPNFDFTATQLIQKIELSTAGKFDFDNLPQDYDRFIIQGKVESDATGNVGALNMYFNADTTDTNYYSQQVYGINAVANGGEAAVASICQVAGSTAVGKSDVQIVIEDPAGSELKTALAQWGNYRTGGDESTTGQRYLTHDSMTAAITRLRLQAANDPTDQLTGTLFLYGQKEVQATRTLPQMTFQAKELIQEIDLTTAGEFDFDNIPQDYDKLIIEGQVASSVGSNAYEEMIVFFNEDLTAANYWTQVLSSSDGTVSGAENFAEAVVAIITPGGSVAEEPFPTQFKAEILNYTSGTLGKVGRSNFVSVRDFDAQLYQGQNGWGHSTLTAAITRLRFRTDNHPTDGLTGKLRLYGERQRGAVQEALPTMNFTAKEEIERITLASASADKFVFANIPQTYEKLWLDCRLHSDALGSPDNVIILFNDDTAQTNYHRQQMWANDGTTSDVEAAADSAVMQATAGDAPTDSWGLGLIEIPGYSRSDVLKSADCNFTVPLSTTNIRAARRYVQHSTLSAVINKITLENSTDPTDKLYGEVILYGERGVSGTEQIQLPALEMPVKVKLAEIELASGSPGDMDFTDIPQDYDELIVEGLIRSDETMTSGGCRMFVNNDLSDANYHYQQLRALDTTVTSAENDASNLLGIVPGASATANGMMRFTARIPNYSDTSTIKQIHSEFNAYISSTSELTGEVVSSNGTTSAITQVTLRSRTPASWGLFGKVTLYGVKTSSAAITPPAGKHEIQTITLSTAGEFDFSGIPQGYKRLVIEGFIESDSAAATNDVAFLILNDDTTNANYYCQYSYRTNTTSTHAQVSEPRIGNIASSTSNAGMSQIRIVLERYASADVKRYRSESEVRMTSTELRVYDAVTHHDSMTDPVSRIRIRTNNHPTDELTGTLTLYGES